MTSFVAFETTFGPRIDYARMDLDQSYEMYQEKGEALFLIKLVEQEAFRDFCDEYYVYMRERWNACSGSMWDSFETFRTKYNGDPATYWAYLKTI
jgi:hypothetical protein